MDSRAMLWVSVYCNYLKIKWLYGYISDQVN